MGFKPIIYLGKYDQSSRLDCAEWRAVDCQMEKVIPAYSKPFWYLVHFSSGSSAVISAEDLVLLVPDGFIESMTRVSYQDGRVFEATLAGYMPATCRIKAGEGDRVG